MARYLIRRLALIPVVLVLVSMLGFAYARAAQRAHANLNPFIAAQARGDARFDAYFAMLGGLLSGETRMPGADNGPPLLGAVLQATVNSLGLLFLSFGLSLVVGLGGGLAAVRIGKAGAASARVARWLSPLASLGMGMPSFYLGALLIAAIMAAQSRACRDASPILPYQGFGWDAHLVLPVIALLFRPAAQTAKIVASLVMEESAKQYVVTARSIGVPWAAIRWRHLLRNVAAPVVLSVAGSFRVLVAELIVVEWLFGWPGLGRMTAWALIPPRLSFDAGAPLFLYPPALAAVFTVMAALFLAADLIASFLAQVWDPRLRPGAVDAEQGTAHA